MLYFIYELWAQANAAGAEWAHNWRWLNIFQYITVRSALACLIAFSFVVSIAPKMILKLISLKLGQPIRSAEEVHKLNELHGAKKGVPTMGGILIIAGVWLSVLLAAKLDNTFIWVTLFGMTSLAALGFMDDYLKIKHQNSKGVSSRGKLIAQALIGLAVMLMLQFSPESANYQLVKEPLSWGALCVPLMKQPLWEMGWLYIIFGAAVMIAMSNVVNLTDGLDGLATGCSLSAIFAYAIMAYLAHHYVIANEYLSIPQNPNLGELLVFLSALAGACFAFMWYNCHPAQVFMGDTGSLAIGGALGVVAIAIKQELMLFVVCAVFVIEGLSVVIQIIGFKTTGKRVFKMAPIHHHFELLGWKETQVTTRFWMISFFCAVIGLLILKIV